MKRKTPSFSRRRFISHSPRDTQSLAAKIARRTRAGDVLLLSANLGVGKTTFAQGFVRAMGVKEVALSPTFILAQTFQGRIPIHHLDFYRLSKKEILDMGVEDYFTGGGLVGPGILVIEWADRFPELWPPDHVRIQIGIDARSNARRFKITASGPRSKAVLRGLKTK
jgi:tRNA threonylcarbamoyladenosine biosynthesis protein TsaE